MDPPNCNTETFTLHTTSNNFVTGSSNSQYVCDINIPLKDVVEASIVTASIANTTSNVVYVGVEELESTFTDYLTPAAAGTSAAGNLRRSLAAFYSDRTTYATQPRIVFYNRYPIDVPFIYPIQRLEKLTITLYDEVGNVLTADPSATFITFRFVCKRKNLC